MCSQRTPASLGIRVHDDFFQQLSDADSSRTGVYWFDLRMRHPVASRVKRTIDVVASTALVVLLAPLILMAVAVTRLSGRGPAVLGECRIGFRGNQFTMYRFRTTDTIAGRLLRRTGVDALPQLFNVLEGSMSLVGPRPLSAEEVEPLRARSRRFSVLPGMTGPWRLNGRRLSAEEEFMLDREYVNRWTLRRDLRILFLRSQD